LIDIAKQFSLLNPPLKSALDVNPYLGHKLPFIYKHGFAYRVGTLDERGEAKIEVE